MLYGSRDANVGALALASYIMKSQHRCSAPFFRHVFAFPKFSTRDVNLGKVLNASPIVLRRPAFLLLLVT